jgi:hypothetical protein
MKRFLRVVTAAAVMLFPAAARSEPTFPPVVDTFIGAPGRVEAMYPDPSMPGCHLCHVNGSTGGLPVTKFGALLGINQTVPTPDELQAALDSLNMTDPRALDDLKMSMDPNEDGSIAGLPQPNYGCGLSSRTPASGSSGACGLLLGVTFVASWQRGRRARLRD